MTKVTIHLFGKLLYGYIACDYNRIVHIVSGGTAEFDKITSGRIRVFLWSGLSGNDAMKPLLDFTEWEISN